MADSHVRSPRLVSITRAAMALACLAAAGLAPGCDGGSGDGDDDGSGGSTSSESPSGGASCNLSADKWYSECDSGCGDVMVCQSFCSDCDLKCMVPCVDNSDCEAVGAGACEESAVASNRCSAAPSKCPGDDDDDDSSSSTTSATTGSGGGGGGGSCSDTGYSCSVNGDCCDFPSGNALCVDYGDGNPLCGATCSAGSECNSGCCAGTDEGNSVCAPAGLCGN